MKNENSIYSVHALKGVVSVDLSSLRDQPGVEDMETKGASQPENTYDQIECYTLEQYRSPKHTNESTQPEKKKTAKQHSSCCKAAFLATVIAVQAFLLAIVAVTIAVIAFRDNLNQVVPSQLSSCKQIDVDGLWSQFNKCNSTNGKN